MLVRSVRHRSRVRHRGEDGRGWRIGRAAAALPVNRLVYLPSPIR